MEEGEKRQFRRRLNSIFATVLVVDRFNQILLVGQFLHDRVSNHGFNRHVLWSNTLDELGGRAIALIVNNGDFERLIFYASVPSPHSESNWSAAKALLWTLLLAIGLEAPFSAVVAFENNSFNIIDI